MPKKNPTPKSILDAPVSVPIVVVRHTAPNRDERRRRRGAWRRPGVNVPHLGHHGNKAVRDA